MAFSGIVFAVLGSVFSLWAIVRSNWSSVTTWLYAPFRLVYVLACWRVALVGARKSPLVGTATFVRILAFIGSVCAGVLGAYSKSATCFVAAQAVESFGLVVALRTYGASGWLPFWEWSDLRGSLRLVAEPFTFREEPLGCGLSALLLGAFGSLWILSWGGGKSSGNELYARVLRGSAILAHGSLSEIRGHHCRSGNLGALGSDSIIDGIRGSVVVPAGSVG